MNIIAGTARNLELATLPDCGVRPTAVRARKALFDSLGCFDGIAVLDLFSGSGALALEAVSRGAASAAMVECDSQHIECIKENCRRVSASGAKGKMTVFEFDATQPERYLTRLSGKPNIVFADPPYAKSGEYFKKFMSDEHFCAFLRGARLIWEIPDTPGAMADFINIPQLDDVKFRRFGGTVFLSGKIK
ncbi:MAG: RsmD family RNA methyltransferase [Lentisphaeria bacterium]|nr:RsmD family RNA methyltransferase [Lentisphaeria bacterium]